MEQTSFSPTGKISKNTHYAECFVSKKIADQINYYLSSIPKSENDCFGEDNSFVKTVKFKDGMEMDIKLCGVQYEGLDNDFPWTEAVLFDHNDTEICHTEPEDEFFGEWHLETKEGSYIANVQIDAG